MTDQLDGEPLYILKKKNKHIVVQGQIFLTDKLLINALLITL